MGYGGFLGDLYVVFGNGVAVFVFLKWISKIKGL